jgi:putative thiamine transport system ATP-binding protein
MSAALLLSAVEMKLGSAVLVPRLDLEVAPGEIVTVMGASGAGKSTLLAFIAGFLDPAFSAQGRVLLGDDDISALPAEQRRVGLLFQDDLLFPHLSVGENLAFGLSPAVRGRTARQARIEAALDQAGLSGMAPRDPGTLSGGQRARVALMRTLLAEPRALLLDEPFNRLDAALRRDFAAFVFDHARAQSLPTLLVTHDIADAEASGGRIIRIAE